MAQNDREVAKGVEGVPDGWIFVEGAWVAPAMAPAKRAFSKMHRGETLSDDEMLAVVPWLLAEVQDHQRRLGELEERARAGHTHPGGHTP